MINLKKTLISIAVVTTMSSTMTHANSIIDPTLNGNFTMLDFSGRLLGGTNDIAFTWDGTLNTDPATAISNATIESATPTQFYGVVWTTYNIKVYGPGTYTFSTADTLGSTGCPFDPAELSLCVSGGAYNVTAAPGQVAAHMKFAWGTTQGIDIVNVWQSGSWTTLNPGTDLFNAIWTSHDGTYIGPEYDFVSTDWNGDDIAGGGMVDGPFPSFNANFNVNIPLPASVWLFGTGLVGLFGLMRRRRNLLQHQ